MEFKLLEIKQMDSVKIFAWVVTVSCVILVLTVSIILGVEIASEGRNQRDYKYRIVVNEDSDYTNTYIDDNGKCIFYTNEEGKEVTLCGEWKIETN